MLTQREQEVLDYINKHFEEHGYMPSGAKIGRDLGGLSRAWVSIVIMKLTNKGKLKPRKKKISEFQIKLLDVIKEGIAANKHSPSITQMAKNLGVCNLTIINNINKLEAHGFINIIQRRPNILIEVES